MKKVYLQPNTEYSLVKSILGVCSGSDPETPEGNGTTDSTPSGFPTGSAPHRVF